MLWHGQARQSWRRQSQRTGHEKREESDRIKRTGATYGEVKDIEAHHTCNKHEGQGPNSVSHTHEDIIPTHNNHIKDVSPTSSAADSAASARDQREKRQYLAGISAKPWAAQTQELK